MTSTFPHLHPRLHLMMKDPRYTTPDGWVTDAPLDLVIRLHETNKQVRYAIETLDGSEHGSDSKYGPHEGVQYRGGSDTAGMPRNNNGNGEYAPCRDYPHDGRQYEPVRILDGYGYANEEPNRFQPRKGVAHGRERPPDQRPYAYTVPQRFPSPDGASYPTAGGLGPIAVPTKIRFSRASASNMTTLRNLPQDTNILLFTPVIIPAGHPLERDTVVVGKAFERQRNRATEKHKRVLTRLGGKLTDSFESKNYPDPRTQVQTMDPFEVFGKALSTYHRCIRHVPYVAQKGFTETHEGFISEADAVITVVCEPNYDKYDQPDYDKYDSMTYQMNFAEDVVDALERKDSELPNALVLVQCGANQYRLPVDAIFENVIECQAYNEEIARSIARTIFEGNIEDGRIEAFAY